MSAVAEKKPRDKLAGWEALANGGLPTYFLKLEPITLKVWPSAFNGLTWFLDTKPKLFVGSVTLNAKTSDAAKREAVSTVKARLVSMLTEVTWTTIGSDNGHDD